MTYSKSQQQCLLEIARVTIEQSTRNGERCLHRPDIRDEELLQPRGNFVTLMLHDNLRGCIGSIEDDGELPVSVAEHAWSAAFRDPRFPAMQEKELNDLSISISILSPKQAIRYDTEQELLDSLRPGIDGLLIEKGKHRATFLPSVWESLPDRGQFLQQLKLKAGMKPAEVPELAWYYTAECISEEI